jgi:orotate phosphoribosyltransferase
MPLAPYKCAFIDFLVASAALKFGEFVLKSGRRAPYFVNTGTFDTGAAISAVGQHYASHIQSCALGEFDVVFGPAYKGIPLSVATASALHLHHKRDVRFAFDRKEAKTHGDKGKIVGRINKGDRLLIVEDVVTAGTTLREIVPFIRQELGANISGVIIAVDRSEKGAGERSAVQEARAEFGIEIFPLVTVHEIKSYLSKPNSSGMVLTEQQQKQIDLYLSEFGAA